MPIPLYIKGYNQHMGGVDIAGHTTDLIWWPMLFCVYDNLYHALVLSHIRGSIYRSMLAALDSQAPQSTRPKFIRPNVKGDISLSLGRSCDLWELSNSSRGGCWLCRWKEGTRWVCSKCEQLLCLNGERNRVSSALIEGVDCAAWRGEGFVR